jgi:hypothetical protein
METMIVNIILILIILAALSGLGWVTKRMWNRYSGLPGLAHWLVDQIAKVFVRR